MSETAKPGWIISATQSSPLHGREFRYTLSRSDRAGTINGLTNADLESLRDSIDSYLRAGIQPDDSKKHGR